MFFASFSMMIFFSSSTLKKSPFVPDGVSHTCTGFYGGTLPQTQTTPGTWFDNAALQRIAAALERIATALEFWEHSDPGPDLRRAAIARLLDMRAEAKDLGADL